MSIQTEQNFSLDPIHEQNGVVPTCRRQHRFVQIHHCSHPFFVRLNLFYFPPLSALCRLLPLRTVPRLRLRFLLFLLFLLLIVIVEVLKHSYRALVIASCQCVFCDFQQTYKRRTRGFDDHIRLHLKLLLFALLGQSI